MDFDKFIERDVLDFLDKQAMLIAEKAAGLREEEFDLYEITKDYSKEIDNALKEEDLRKAQKIFEDVKTRYLKAPDNSLSKKRLYTMMEEIYERIKDYEAKEEGKKSLFETIREYEEKGLFTMPEMLPGKEMQNFNLLIRSVAEKEKILEKVTARKPLRGTDLQEAIKAYREMKELIRRIPGGHQIEKAKAYDTALSWYYTIKKLTENLGAEAEIKAKAAAAPAKVIADEKMVSQRLAEIRMLKEKIVESHKKISDFIRKKDFKESVTEYRNLRKLIEDFPQEMEDEKTALLADALSLYESIKKLKHLLVQKQEEALSEAHEEKAEQGERKGIKEEIAKSLGKVKGLLSQKDVVKAIAEYKVLKNLFTSYPDQPIEEKKKLYDDILTTHKDIKMLEEDFKKNNAPSYEKKVAEINQCVQKIHDLLDNGKTEEATQMLLEAKHRLQLLPSEAFDDKYRLVKEIENLEHKIMFVNTVQKMDNQNNPNMVQK